MFNLLKKDEKGMAALEIIVIVAVIIVLSLIFRKYLYDFIYNDLGDMIMAPSEQKIVP